MCKVLFKISLLFCLSIYSQKAFCYQKELSNNITIKPVIFFDDEIITDIEFEVYEKIITFLNQNQQFNKEEVAQNLITNLAKRKYVLKYITETNENDFLPSVKSYVSSLSQKLNKSERQVFEQIKLNPQHLKIMEKYISNELMWANAISTSIAPSIRIESGEIQSFLKSHPNANEEIAYQTLTQQKIEPLSQTILEQVKKFTYTKIMFHK